jgi:hypothetical protein
VPGYTSNRVSAELPGIRSAAVEARGSHELFAVNQWSICTLKFWTSFQGNTDCESGSHSESMCPGCG